MTSKEFVLWLKGFSEGVHEFNITPKQWDILKDKLAEVKDDDTKSSPFPFGTPNTAPFVTLPHITPGPSINPNRPYEVYCGDNNGTTNTPSMVVTTTPGTTGHITISNPNLVSWGSGSLSTSTTYTYPSGSAWHYTNGGNKDIKE